VAPILSFTADELWHHLPGAREESVHVARFPAAADLEALGDDELVHRWSELLDVRQAVTSSIEVLRQEKQIGTSLQAQVSITATGADLALLQRYREQLPMLFIVSEVAVRSGGQTTAEQDEARHGSFGIVVDRVSGVKCQRCWRYVRSLSSDPEAAGICERCADALSEPVGSAG
jgi:isoleucyl-tRNA synthetase